MATTATVTRLEKCCITSAYLQWLFHSGERAVTRGPLVSNFTWKLGSDISCKLVPKEVFFLSAEFERIQQADTMRVVQKVLSLIGFLSFIPGIF